MDTRAGDDVGAGHALHARTAVPLAGDGGEVIRRALDGGALHVVQDAAHTTQFARRGPGHRGRGAGGESRGR